MTHKSFPPDELAAIRRAAEAHEEAIKQDSDESSTADVLQELTGSDVILRLIQEIDHCHERLTDTMQSEEDLTWWLCKLVEQLGGPLSCSWDDFRELPLRIERMLAVVNAANEARLGPLDQKFMAEQKLDRALLEFNAYTWGEATI